MITLKAWLEQEKASLAHEREALEKLKARLDARKMELDNNLHRLRCVPLENTFAQF